MARRGGGRGNFRNSESDDQNRNFVKRPRPAVSLEVKNLFDLFRSELDERNDKWERLVKCSRDITIESKRIIFLLHRITQNDENVLNEADERLNQLRSSKFSFIARELQNEDSNFFVGAYRPGLQEYIEAASFLRFLRDGRLLDLQEVGKPLNFEKEGRIDVHLVDYLCGVGDLTGELMRLAINYVSAGNFQRPVEICQFLNRIYRGFVLLGHSVGSKDFNFKLRVAKQNLEKVESACYVIKLRGSEVPEYMLADVMTNLFTASSQNDSNFGRNDVDYAEV